MKNIRDICNAGRRRLCGVGLVSSVRALRLGQAIDLPTSKQIVRPVPGSPQRMNSLPMSMAVSPDGRYVVTVNAGYGTFESEYDAVAGGDGYADGKGDGFSG